jgi:hypothetical protein
VALLAMDCATKEDQDWTEWLDIHGFVDVDWTRDLDRRRSTSRYVFNLFGGAISWMRKRQVVVALSTTEVEYMASHSCK